MSGILYRLSLFHRTVLASCVKYLQDTKVLSFRHYKNPGHAYFPIRPQTGKRRKLK